MEKYKRDIHRGNFIRRLSLFSHSTFKVRQLNESLFIQESFILSVFMSFNQERPLYILCLLMKSTR